MSLEIMYDDIVETLESLTDSEGKKIFHTVGLWNIQILNEELERAFNFPACYIHFETIGWRQKTAAGGFNAPETEEQESERSVVTIHICHSLLQDAKTSFKIYHPINQRVYYALNNKKTEEYGPLVRIAERQDPNHDRIIDWQMDFRFMVIQVGQQVDKTEVAENSINLDVSGPS